MVTKQELKQYRSIVAEMDEVRDRLNNNTVSDTVVGSDIHFPYTTHVIGVGGVTEGLKVKYLVTKIEDGSVVEDCFVLRPQIDEAARSALYAYAATTNNLLLAADIRKWLKSIEAENRQSAPSELEEIVELYQNNIAPITPIVYHSLEDWLKSVDADVIKLAIKETAERNIHHYKYVESILKSNHAAGRTTLAAVEDANRNFKNRKGQPDSVFNDSHTDYDEIERMIQGKM